MKSYTDYMTSSPMTDGEEIRDFLNDDWNENEDPDDYTSNRTETPCDFPDSEGHYHCPYDAQGSNDCRNYCGLGVDE